MHLSKIFIVYELYFNNTILEIKLSQIINGLDEFISNLLVVVYSEIDFKNLIIFSVFTL